MEVRKLVQSGPASFTVALPKKWVDMHKLKKGDLMNIEELPDKVMISPNSLKTKPSETKEIKICIDGKDPIILRRDMRNAYLAADKITIYGKTLPERLQEVKDEASEVVALEVVDETSASITFASFINLKEINMQFLIRRIDNILRSMLTDLLGCINNKEMSNSVIGRDESVNRLSFLLLKCMRKALMSPEILRELQLDYFMLVIYWELNLKLENTADDCKRLVRLLAEKPKKIDAKGLQNMFKMIAVDYADAMTSFYNNDVVLCDAVRLRKQNFFDTCGKFIRNNNDAKAAEIVERLKALFHHTHQITRVVRLVNP